MRKITATAFLSLDGIMQAPGGPEEDTDDGFKYGGWTFHYWDEIMGEVMGKGMATPFDLLLGRKTYDIFAAHWPRVEAGDPIGEKFNAATKYVATSSPDTLNWENTVALGTDIPGAVRKLGQSDGPDLLIQGSSQLLHALLANDLIDELNLWIFPLLLGKGKPFFNADTKPVALTLASSKASTTGVVMNTYHKAGAIKTGSFALE
ncbi:dihydrofolate reductase family protein [Phyllobacterium sp. YR531]|uniref:dihydrofolate reductase family protein n=1 Tax=Phyllobacterium sp. YR531 TaxID=1144343 RepID=UPI00026F52D2|nr:dihydrofolate reductase family protein [Phyllobacterium sp. YR531]EJM99991.1 dihydrofolate reductase [Phyllobacterium sp. YR531]